MTTPEKIKRNLCSLTFWGFIAGNVLVLCIGIFGSWDHMVDLGQVFLPVLYTTFFGAREWNRATTAKNGKVVKTETVGDSSVSYEGTEPR